MSMTGIYGEPLELIKTWLQSLEAFGAFSPSTAVYLYDRLGSDTPPEVGDARANLSYPDASGHTITLTPGLDVQRQVEVCLSRVVRGITESAKEAIVNDTGAIVAGLIAANEATGQITQIKLKTLALDETCEPPQIGAILLLFLDMGGR